MSGGPLLDMDRAEHHFGLRRLWGGVGQLPPNKHGPKVLRQPSTSRCPPIMWHWWFVFSLNGLSESADRFKSGLELLQTWDRTGFTQALYLRSFFLEELDGDAAMTYDKRHKLVNEALDLPKEGLDERTKIALTMAENLFKGSYGHLKN